MGGLLTAPGGKLLKVWSSSEMETPAGMGFPWDQEFVLFPVFFSACSTCSEDGSQLAYEDSANNKVGLQTG